MIEELKILQKHGRQYIPDIRTAEVPPPFRGKIEITDAAINEEEAAAICPTGAILPGPFRIDMGRCVFCNECAISYPDKIRFTNNHNLATNDRERLIVSPGSGPIEVNPKLVRNEIRKIFGRSLKLRQVCAGGDNSTEKELVACGNVNFDMGRFGIEFVASPRHADGIVLSGPISAAMSRPFEVAYAAIPSPKLLILAGVDAISGGIFSESPALDRSVLDKYQIDLYVPGNPPHPLTFINGVLNLIQSRPQR